MKGEIKAGHIGLNQFELKIQPGPTTIVFTEVSGMASETTSVELPDRTQATGGEETVGEFTAMLPMHHDVERIFMDVWHQEARDPVIPSYKRAGVMLFRNIHNDKTIAYALTGLYVSNRVLPDVDMANDGEMAKIEYTFKYDSIIPLP